MAESGDCSDTKKAGKRKESELELELDIATTLGVLHCIAFAKL